MSVKLASASIDEHGKARGGKPGDQTGREVRIQNYYLHSKGWRVFRPLSPVVAEKIAYDAEAAAKNNKIGYNQDKRNTLYNVSKPFGFDAAKVKTACDCDCSALVRVCLAFAGISVPASFRTSNEPKTLLATGDFVEMTGDNYTKSKTGDYLKRGDILCTPTPGHTVVVITDGKYANISPSPSVVKYIEVIGGSVNVRTAPNISGRILGIVHKGDLLPYGGKDDNGWHLIEYKNQNAWISGKYSKKV